MALGFTFEKSVLVLWHKEYVLKIEVQEIKVPTIGTYSLEPVVTGIYNNKGQPLELSVTKPEITIFAPGHFSEWKDNCRVRYAVQKSK